MYLTHLHIKNHPILKDLSIDLINKATGRPYSIIAFVGENGCGKTTLLNEIFNYENSKYIVDKEKELLSLAPHTSFFLRQNSLVKNVIKEIGKRIDGKDRNEVNSFNPVGRLIDTLSPMVDKEQGLKILEILDDVEIFKLFKEGVIEDVACGSEISQLIDGKKAGYDISNYSSGQQEILLKLKDLKEFDSNTDSVLLDEPETSLHPRWQQEIVNLIRTLLVRPGGQKPQTFIATHSEKILQSLIKNEDALIVRLYKEKGMIKNETINQMHLLLRRPTFAELDYVIFKIDSYEYCNELFDLLEWLYNVSGDRGVDRNIQKSEFYDELKHYKEWYNDKFGKVTCFTLPVYVRNYFHHPKDRVEPTPQELHEAIELLRNIVLNLNK